LRETLRVVKKETLRVLNYKRGGSTRE
jgi:hypothetical protein